MVWMAFPDSKIADGEQGIAFFTGMCSKLLQHVHILNDFSHATG
jgi:hypothetical protein